MQLNMLDTPEKMEAYARGLEAGAAIERIGLNMRVDKALGRGLLIGTALGVILTVLFAPPLMTLLS